MASSAISTVTVDAPPVGGTVTTAAVRAGDLVFCARPSFLQELCTRAGEPWRHVGLATPSPAGMVIAEIAGARFGARPLDEVVAASEAAAIARVAPADRPAAATAAARAATRAGSSQLYAWDDVVLAGFIAATRLHARRQDAAKLGAAIEAATATVAARRPPPGTESLTCSSFVASVLRDSGVTIAFELRSPRATSSRPSLIDLLSKRQRPLRHGGGSHMTVEQLRYLVHGLVRGVVAGWVRSPTATAASERDLIRWITPGDIWRSPTVVERFYLQPLASTS